MKSEKYGFDHAFAATTDLKACTNHWLKSTMWPIWSRNHSSVRRSVQKIAKTGNVEAVQLVKIVAWLLLWLWSPDFRWHATNLDPAVAKDFHVSWWLAAFLHAPAFRVYRLGGGCWLWSECRAHCRVPAENWWLPSPYLHASSARLLSLCATLLHYFSSCKVFWTSIESN